MLTVFTNKGVMVGGRRPSVEDDRQWKTTVSGRRPSVEDDLHWRDFEITLCHIPPLRSFFYWTSTDKLEFTDCSQVNQMFGCAAIVISRQRMIT